MCVVWVRLIMNIKIGKLKEKSKKKKNEKSKFNYYFIYYFLKF